MASNREQELEEEVELLRQQLDSLTGSSKEIGVLLSLRHGMTHRLATILHILVKRSPAIVTRNSLHAIFYGHQDDGGPEPKIFAVHITRLRGILQRLAAEGRIETVWNSGYRASPELVRWVQQLYAERISNDG